MHVREKQKVNKNQYPLSFKGQAKTGGSISENAARFTSQAGARPSARRSLAWRHQQDRAHTVTQSMRARRPSTNSEGAEKRPPCKNPCTRKESKA